MQLLLNEKQSASVPERKSASYFTHSPVLGGWFGGKVCTICRKIQYILFSKTPFGFVVLHLTSVNNAYKTKQRVYYRELLLHWISRYILITYIGMGGRYPNIFRELWCQNIYTCATWTVTGKGKGIVSKAICFHFLFFFLIVLTIHFSGSWLFKGNKLVLFKNYAVFFFKPNLPD